MKNWKTYKLGELIEINKNSITKDFRFDIIEYLDTSSVTENRFAELQVIKLSDAPSRAKRIVKNDDIVYSTVRPNQKHFGIVKNAKPNTIASTGFAVITPTKIDPNFLYYYLAQNEIVGFLNGVAESNTTTFPAFNASLLETIDVTIPDSLKTQQSIASILSSLDNKIELNLQMNQTLEAMAQAIFKEWFVNFNFPGFDGRLVGGLPKGWRMGKVSDSCIVNKNTLSIKDEIETIDYIEISEVSKGIINKISTYNRGEEPSRARRKLQHGDTVLSTVRPDRGSYFLAIEPKQNQIASTGFAVFTPTSVPYSFLYCFLTDDKQFEFYGRKADGAAYPAINPSIIMDMELVIPTDEILKLFQSVAGNLYLRMNGNLAENKNLSQIRDSLLPQLMTGKIEIKA